MIFVDTKKKRERERGEKKSFFLFFLNLIGKRKIYFVLQAGVFSSDVSIIRTKNKKRVEEKHCSFLLWSVCCFVFYFVQCSDFFVLLLEK